MALAFFDASALRVYPGITYIIVVENILLKNIINKIKM